MNTVTFQEKKKHRKIVLIFEYCHTIDDVVFRIVRVRGFIQYAFDPNIRISFSMSVAACIQVQ